MKKLILEYNDQELINLKNVAPKLAGAMFTNCFNAKAAIVLSEPVTKKPAIYFKSEDQANAATPHIFYFNDGVKEKRNTGDDKADPNKTVKSTWKCKTMEEKTDPNTTGISNDVIASLRASDWKLWSEVSGQDVVKYKLVNLKTAVTDPKIRATLPKQVARLFDDPAYSDQFQKDFLMWMPMSGGLQQSLDLGGQFQACIARAKELGFQDMGRGKPTDTNAVEMDIRTLPNCDKVSEDPYYVYKITPKGDIVSSLMDSLLPPAEGTQVSIEVKEESAKSRCKNIITLYYTAANQKEDIDQNQLNQIKPEINKCIVKLPTFKFMVGKNKLEKMVAALQSSGPITTVSGKKVNYNPKVMTENIDRRLKSIIRENLINASKNKQKGLLQESKIVKNRFNILAEGVNHKTKKGQRIIAKRLFTEMAYLNTQGFDKKIINEQIWDFFKSLFGNTFSFEPVFDYFKEYLVKSLLDQFGVDTTGWIGNIVITTIGNIELSEIDRLTDCNYLSKILSKSIAEGAIRKLQGQSVGVGPLQDILRNALVDTLGETDLGNKIESFLGQLICPLISKVAGNMGSTMDSMKAKALGAA